MNKMILIVEDEASIARGLQINLQADGFRTTIIRDGKAAVEYIISTPPDLVLLDVMLPGLNGFEVCERVRASGSQVPILFLTALDRTDDRIRGLELGGDDYITKPFAVRELILRIKAVLRRQEWLIKAPRQGNVFKFGANRGDFSSYKVDTRRGSITMTRKEAMLLKLLIDNEGIVIGRDQIIDQLWGYDYDRTNRTIDNLILKLRRYFEPEPKAPKYILTHYGAGYQFISRSD